MIGQLVKQECGCRMESVRRRSASRPSRRPHQLTVPASMPSKSATPLFCEKWQEVGVQVAGR